MYSNFFNKSNVFNYKYKNACNLFMAKKYCEALNKFKDCEKYINNSKDNDKIYYSIALCLWILDEYDKSLCYLYKVEHKNMNTEILYKLIDGITNNNIINICINTDMKPGFKYNSLLIIWFFANITIYNYIYLIQRLDFIVCFLIFFQILFISTFFTKTKFYYSIILSLLMILFSIFFKNCPPAFLLYGIFMFYASSELIIKVINNFENARISFIKFIKISNINKNYNIALFLSNCLIDLFNNIKNKQAEAYYIRYLINLKMKDELNAKRDYKKAYDLNHNIESKMAMFSLDNLNNFFDTI